MNYRKAKITDVEDIHYLLTYYSREGLVLARPRAELYENIREFSVVDDNGTIAGAGSLHIMWHDLAEIRSLAVEPSYTRQGVGSSLVKLFLKEAEELCIPRVFTLTYKEEFFIKCSFQRIAKEELPQKVWRDCIACPKFPNCDEIAMIKELDTSIE